MAMDFIGLSVGMGYTDETVIGGGALKGKNCVVSNIEEVADGVNVTFQSILDDGTVKTDTAFIPKGTQGEAGVAGKSAYEIWLEAGNTGTEEDFLISLVGEKGDDGKSAYQYAQDGGYIGTETEFTTNIARSGVISKELEVERARIVDLEKVLLNDNLFNKTTITKGYRLGIDGELIADNGYFVSDYIEVDSKHEYYKNSPQKDAFHRVCFYQSSKFFYTYSAENEIIIDDKIKYIRICGLIEELNKTIVCIKSAKDYIARETTDTIHKILRHSEIEFEYGYRILTNANEVDINSRTQSDAYKCAVVPCKQGESFVINGGGGGTSMLWSFIDSNTHKIVHSVENAICKNEVITAPLGTEYLIINDSFDEKSYKCIGANEKKGLLSKNIYIAPYNATESDKMIADIVCDGVNDELDINTAISLLPYGGTIYLMDGEFRVDSLKNGYNSTFGIYFPYVENTARTITIKGCTENKSYLSNYGTVIRVTETAFNELSDDVQYSVIGSTFVRMEKGDIQAHPNNLNIENLYIFIHNSQKKVIGINGSEFGSMFLKQVGVYTSTYFEDRFNHIRPATPIDGSIGVLSVQGSNDEIARIGMDLVQVGGFHTGIYLKGVDHLIMQVCAACKCVYGYIFEELSKTLTMLNCADEGNTHLPRFNGEGHLTCIDLNVERFNFDYIPYDPSGDTERYATESEVGSFKGFISYTMQSHDATFEQKFWKDEHGIKFKTVDLNNPIW